MARLSQNHMREYETLFILHPDVSDEDAVAYLTKVKGFIEKNGGKHIRLNNLGKKKLAWERDRQQKGMFVEHRFLGKPGIVRTYERQLGIDEQVMLRQTTVLSKSVDAASRNAEEDVLEPPAPKERRDDEGDSGDRRDRRDRRDSPAT